MTYKAIGQYGLIGDMKSAALIGTDGSIDWCCLPRFDSPSVFAGILDHKLGGVFRISPVSEHISSKQSYVQDTNILKTEFVTSTGKMMITDFAMSLSRSAEDKENGTGRWHVMKNRYGADGITYDSIMDTSIGKIEINIRGNNRNTQNAPGDISPAERRRLRNSSENFFNI